jgi:hypothetical protein
MAEDTHDQKLSAKSGTRSRDEDPGRANQMRANLDKTEHWGRPATGKSREHGGALSSRTKTKTGRIHSWRRAPTHRREKSEHALDPNPGAQDLLRRRNPEQEKKTGDEKHQS